MAKAYPEEKVGVFAQRGDAVEVVEYSELDPQEAASVDPGIPAQASPMKLGCDTDTSSAHQADHSRVRQS